MEELAPRDSATQAAETPGSASGAPRGLTERGVGRREDGETEGKAAGMGPLRSGPSEPADRAEATRGGGVRRRRAATARRPPLGLEGRPASDDSTHELRSDGHPGVLQMDDAPDAAMPG